MTTPQCGLVLCHRCQVLSKSTVTIIMPQALRISLDTEPDTQDRSKPGTCYDAFSVTVTVHLALMGLTKLTLLQHIISFLLFHGFNSSGYPKRQHNRHLHLHFQHIVHSVPWCRLSTPLLCLFHFKPTLEHILKHDTAVINGHDTLDCATSLWPEGHSRPPQSSTNDSQNNTTGTGVWVFRTIHSVLLAVQPIPTRLILPRHVHLRYWHRHQLLALKQCPGTPHQHSPKFNTKIYLYISGYQSKLNTQVRQQKSETSEYM